MLRMDHRGKAYFRGPAAEVLVQDMSGVTKASFFASNTAPIKLWDNGSGSLKTGTLVNGTLAWA